MSRAGLILALGLLLAVHEATAQVSPNGPEFQVNTDTSGGQFYPEVAVAPEGNFVVAWGSESSSGSDTSGYSIQAQRFSATGVPLGPQFQVNSYTTNDQTFQSVAVDALGGFVVVWDSLGSTGTDTSFSSIQAQKFDSNGVPLGGQFQVNTYTTDDQFFPRVAADAQGDFIVVWASFGSSGTDTDGISIQARRFGADGVPLGAEFQVNTHTPFDQLAPRVALDDEDRFTVVWQNWTPAGTGLYGFSVHAQRYAANGDPLGAEFQVNTQTNSYQDRPDVASDARGNLVFVWQSQGSFGTDTDSFSIQARRYAADGTALGTEFQVNTYTTGYQGLPSVAMDGQSRFTVVWQSLGSSGGDTSSFSCHAQRYDSMGDPLGGEFQVNSYTTASQGLSRVATDPEGNFVVAWESDGSSGTDASGLSIQAQRYDELFRDGFETGDTGRWTLTSP